MRIVYIYLAVWIYKMQPVLSLSQTGARATRLVPMRTPINLASNFNRVHWVRRRYSLLLPNEAFALPSWEINSTFALLFVAVYVSMLWKKQFSLKMYGSCRVVMYVHGAWCWWRVQMQVEGILKLSYKVLLLFWICNKNKKRESFSHCWPI